MLSKQLEKYIPLFRRVSEARGKLYAVGGLVRDYFLGLDNKDKDLELYGLEIGEIEKILNEFGTVDLVGKSFGVFKLTYPDGETIDISLPRTDRKVGAGHKGIEICGDAFLEPRVACSRRDFTVGAMMYDPLEDKYLDFFGGRQDLENKIIRAVYPDTFGEDSLRVLRAAQFAGRFGFTIEEETIKLCQSIDLSDLPADRIREEVYKLLLKSKEPSIGIVWMENLHIIDKLFPEFKHVLEHDKLAALMQKILNNAATLEENLLREEKLTLMLSALCSLLGTNNLPIMSKYGMVEVCSHNTSEAKIFLDRLNIFTENSYDIRKNVLQLVGLYFKPFEFFDKAFADYNIRPDFRRLAATGVNFKLLTALTRSVERAIKDCAFLPKAFVSDWFEKTAKAINIFDMPEPSLIKGQDLLDIGCKPGKHVGEMLKILYDMQINELFADKEHALRYAEGTLKGKGLL